MNFNSVPHPTLTSFCFFTLIYSYSESTTLMILFLSYNVSNRKKISKKCNSLLRVYSLFWGWYFYNCGCFHGNLTNMHFSAFANNPFINRCRCSVFNWVRKDTSNQFNCSLEARLSFTPPLLSLTRLDWISTCKCTEIKADSTFFIPQQLSHVRTSLRPTPSVIHVQLKFPSGGEDSA